MVEIEESASDAEDKPGPNEELEEDEDEDETLRDETCQEEDERYLDSLEIPAEKLREVGTVSDKDLVAARRALRKVSVIPFFFFLSTQLTTVIRPAS